jgi:hypothetical protein
LNNYSLPKQLRTVADLTIPIPPNESIAVDSLGLTGDQDFVRLSVAGRLSELGYRVYKLENKPTYLARIMLQGLGTEQGTSFLGMPPVQSVLIPFSLPEITIYKKVTREALSRLSLSVYRADSRRLISKTPWYEASTHYNQFVVLLFMSFLQTNLVLPQHPVLYE